MEKEPLQTRRKRVNIDSIKERINKLNWYVQQIPIRKGSLKPEERVIKSWKLIAIKPDKSVQVDGSTLDEAYKNLGIALGVVSKLDLMCME